MGVMIESRRVMQLTYVEYDAVCLENQLVLLVSLPPLSLLTRSESGFLPPGPLFMLV